MHSAAYRLLAICLVVGVWGAVDAELGYTQQRATDTIPARVVIGDTVLIRTVVPKRQPDTDSVYLKPYRRTEYRWYTGQYLKYSVSVQLVGITSPSECIRRKVLFVPLTSEAKSGTAPAAIEAPGQFDGSRCNASTRWRLGDTPGKQRMQARLARDTTKVATDSAAVNDVIDFDANAHAPANIIVGAAYLPGGIKGVQGDTTTIVQRSRSFQPILGFDLPLAANFIPAWGWLDHVRLMFATSIRDVASDLYIGMELFPLPEGSRGEVFPFQASIGSRIGFKSKENFFLAIHYSATSVLSTLVGVLK